MMQNLPLLSDTDVQLGSRIDLCVVCASIEIKAIFNIRVYQINDKLVADVLEEVLGLKVITINTWPRILTTAFFPD